MTKRSLKTTILYAIALLIASISYMKHSEAGFKFKLDPLFVSNCKEVSFNEKQVYFRCEGRKALLAYSREKFEIYYGKVVSGMEIKARGENPVRVASGD